MNKKIIITLVLFFATVIINAQNDSQDIVAGKKIKIFSQIVNEEKEIFISLPQGYDQTKKRFPVVYISDGSVNRVIGSGGMIRYFAYEKMPQVIAVYIPHPKRGRDLSISENQLDQLPESGGKGGENFLKFFTQELIPFIDNTYRTTTYRILVGYSAGGGFVFNTLLTKPEYFDAYIAASPSFYFEDEIIDRTKKFFSSYKSLDKFLFVPYFQNDITVNTKVYPKINKIIKENIPKGFNYKVKIYEGQRHVPPTSLYDGLMELFKNWKNPKAPLINPEVAYLQNEKPIHVTIKSSEKEIRYTLDGSEPTRESNLYSKPFDVSKPCIIKAKSFQTNICESDAAVVEIKKSSTILPETNIADLKTGLQYKYYDRRWYLLPDTINVKPDKEGVIKNFTIAPKTKQQGFMFKFDGFIRIDKEGYYRFNLFTTVISKFFINDIKIIEATDSNVEQDLSGEIYLIPGYYLINALYSNAWSNGEDFKVSYEGPGIKKQEIPAKVLFYKSNN